MTSCMPWKSIIGIVRQKKAEYDYCRYTYVYVRVAVMGSLAKKVVWMPKDSGASFSSVTKKALKSVMYDFHFKVNHHRRRLSLLSRDVFTLLSSFSSL